MNTVKIKFPKDYCATGTKLFVETDIGGWSEVTGVTRIEILPLEPDSLIVAKIDMVVTLETITACALLSENSVAAAAAHYGMKLVPIDG